MSRVCNLSEQAIRDFIEKAQKEAEKALVAARERIAALLRALSEFRWRIDQRKQEHTSLQYVVSEARRAYGGKYDTLRYKLEKTPKTIKEQYTETVTTKDSEGNTQTSTVTKERTVPNPEYRRLQAVKADFEAFKRELDYYEATVRELADELRRCERELEEGNRICREAEEKLDEIERKLLDRIQKLCELAEEKRKILAEVKRGDHVFPAIREDSGSVDLDGLYSYVRDLDATVDRCRSHYDKLTSDFEEIGYSWRDDVFHYFKRSVCEEERYEFVNAISRLDAMQESLSRMHDRLCDYASEYGLGSI